MKGDFTGFSFAGIHSSHLNIVRVSGGDRYTEGLQPAFEDKQTFIEGRDGEYYFGSNYQARQITISIAFDSVTEKQFRLISNLFATKKVCPLIFDERPYKMYLAKIAEPINLDYVCFDEEKIIPSPTPQKGIRIVDREYVPGSIEEVEWEQIYPYEHTGEKRRIYKGEGEITFVCTEPFARAPYKVLEAYESEGVIHGYIVTAYDNIDEWDEASGILRLEEYDSMSIDRPCYYHQEVENPTGSPVENEYYELKGGNFILTEDTEVIEGKKYYTLDGTEKFYINLYNPGDLPSPFNLYLPFKNGKIKNSDGTSDQFFVRIGQEIMIFNTITKRATDENATGIMINTGNHLIESVKYSSEDLSWTTTGELYNDCLIKGDFAKIIPFDPYEMITNNTTLKQKIESNCDVSLDEVRIFYNYLYY